MYFFHLTAALGLRIFQQAFLVVELNYSHIPNFDQGRAFFNSIPTVFTWTPPAGERRPANPASVAPSPQRGVAVRDLRQLRLHRRRAAVPRRLEGGRLGRGGGRRRRRPQRQPVPQRLRWGRRSRLREGRGVGG